MEKQLKFKVKFKKDDNMIEQEIEKFFHTLIISHFVRLENSPKCSFDLKPSILHIQNFDYTEPIYEMNITLNFKANKELIFYESCKRWCEMCESKSYSIWLIPCQLTHFNKKEPSHKKVMTMSFAFGTMPDMCHFMNHYSYHSLSTLELFTSFEHNKKFFTLFLASMHSVSCRNKLSQKIIVQYDAIVRVIIEDVPNADDINVYFQLDSPPHVYIEQVKVNKKSSLNFFYGTKQNRDFRSKQWERNLVFGCACNNSLCHVKDVGRALVFKISFKSKLTLHAVIERIMQRCAKSVEFCYSSLKIMTSPMFDANNPETCFIVENMSLDKLKAFSCMYAWKLLFSQSLQIRDQIYLNCNKHRSYWQNLKHNITTLIMTNSDAFCNAIYQISEMIEKNEIFSFMEALNKLFNKYCTISVEELPKGMCLIRRMIITPSRQILYPPTEYFDNRVIRKFPNATEFLLRVSVQDDNFSKLTFAVQFHLNKYKFMRDVAGDPIRNGISISNRVYEMLGCSNSQLREHSFWCYAMDETGTTAQSLRKWLGDFSHIRNIAKYVARIGQCFSTSDEAVQISISNAEEASIDDIKSLNGKYTFSDGIGKISSDLANEVRSAKEKSAKSIPEDCTLYKPSAFQIRYKGCKGMLAEDPTLRSNRTRRLIAYRPSMKKFECTSTNKLEIVKKSSPSAMYLNRPLITILEQLGVPNSVFLDLQKKMILEMIEALIYEDKAVFILDSYLSLDMSFKAIRHAGVALTEEPFFHSLLLAIFQYSVDKLKTKARIAIPPQYGRNMLGVLDETRTLRYGQVFVQYSEEIGMFESKTHILKGTVVVTKNPSMHPGDVRKLEAVDVPALRHLKDVVVFPAVGPRPHPDEMAGSDLDGDEFIVMWMPKLIFSRPNVTPMDYPIIEEERHDRPFTVDDMVQFLCDFIQNDNIGTLASAHLSWADQNETGIFSPVCISLAKKYPFVLDFAKTGQTKILGRDEKPKRYPDFMVKGSRNNSYQSQRALGMLYRFVKNLEACIERVDLTNYNASYDKSFEYPGWQRYEKAAENHRKEYASTLMLLLNKYNIKSEVEALSGFIKRDSNNAFKQKELDNTVSIVKSILSNLRQKYRYIFLSELENELLSDREKELHKYQKASAWYMVTYRNRTSPILSFPWIMSDVLIKLRKERNNDLNHFALVKSSLFDNLDKSLHHKYTSKDDSICPCMYILKEIIPLWVISCRVSLKMSSSKRACINCCQRILANFGNKCCSESPTVCECFEKCSPTRLIMAFMRFYLSNVFNLEYCAEDCKGFKKFHLQIAALRAYASIAVARNFEILGIDVQDENSFQDELSEEGDPVRIAISAVLKYYIENDIDQVVTMLKAWTNVNDIQIIAEEQKANDFYALISSTGTSWQRWELEQLVMRSDFASLLESEISSKISPLDRIRDIHIGL